MKSSAFGEFPTNESMRDWSTLPLASLVRYLTAIALESLMPARFWKRLLGIQSWPPESEEEPPNFLPFSNTATEAPVEEAARAAVRPLAPEPTTTTS